MQIKAISILPNNNRTPIYIERAFRENHVDLTVLKTSEVRHLERLTAKLRPDLIFFSKEPELAPYLARIKTHFPRVIFAVWNVDTRLDISEWSDEKLKTIGLADYIFTLSNGNVPQYKTMFKTDKVFHLPQGIDKQINHKYPLTVADKKKYTTDILFVGDIKVKVHDSRKYLLDLIKANGLNVEVYGGARPLFGVELMKAIQCAKICLDISDLTTLSGTVSVRVFEILGAGGFLLGPSYKDIDLIFKDPIKTYAAYTTHEDCINKIKFYLDRPTLRQEIADFGYQFCHKSCTYTQRITQMLKEIFPDGPKIRRN